MESNALHEMIEYAENYSDLNHEVGQALRTVILACEELCHREIEMEEAHEVLNITKVLADQYKRLTTLEAENKKLWAIVGGDGARLAAMEEKEKEREEEAWEGKVEERLEVAERVVEHIREGCVDLVERVTDLESHDIAGWIRCQNTCMEKQRQRLTALEKVAHKPKGDEVWQDLDRRICALEAVQTNRPKDKPTLCRWCGEEIWRGCDGESKWIHKRDGRWDCGTEAAPAEGGE